MVPGGEEPGRVPNGDENFWVEEAFHGFLHRGGAERGEAGDDKARERP